MDKSFIEDSENWGKEEGVEDYAFPLKQKGPQFKQEKIEKYFFKDVDIS